MRLLRSSGTFTHHSQCAKGDTVGREGLLVDSLHWTAGGCSPRTFLCDWTSRTSLKRDHESVV